MKNYNLNFKLNKQPLPHRRWIWNGRERAYDNKYTGTGRFLILTKSRQ